MRNRWPISVGIAVVGLLAGVAIAGRPTVSDSFLTNAQANTSSVPSTTVVPPSTAPSTSVVPSSSVFSTSVVTSSSSPSSTSTADSVATSLSLPTTTAPRPATSVAATTAVPTTSGPATTAPPAGTLDRALVRLVLANGDGRYNLVGANKARLEAVGYVSFNQEDVARVDATVLYYRPGFDDEAAVVAADLLVPDAMLRPLPDTPVTGNDAAGDIIVVLGPDAVR